MAEAAQSGVAAGAVGSVDDAAPAVSRSSRRPRLTLVLARALLLVTLVPFVPLVWLTWSGYRAELAGLEAEISASNRQVARLAVELLDGLIERVQVEARAAVQQAGGEGLPVSEPAVRWERVARDGTVLASQLDPARVGRRCGYLPLLERLASGSGELSRVGRWIEGRAPTVLLLQSSHEGGSVLVAVLEPDALHALMNLYSGVGVDRHVYVVDGTGALLFYSDLAVSRRGDDLRANPPIRLLLDGGEGEISFQSVVSGKQRLGVVQRLQGADWGVVVSADAGELLLELRGRWRTIAWSMSIALALALAILILTSRRVVAPLLDIVRSLSSLDRLPHAPLPVRPATRRVAEYDQLVRAFDELSAEVAAVERELVQAEKSSLLGQLASGLAHEMGTPLNVIIGNAQYLLRKTPQGDATRPLLERIVVQARGIAEMIRRLLDLSRPAEARLEPTDLAAVLGQAVEMARGMSRGVEIVTSVAPETPRVMADPKLIEHALLNLVVNACQAMPDGGRLTLTAAPEPDRAPDGAGGRVRIQVRDTGAGILPEHIERVFEPFFSTKPQGTGTGLGLAIVDRIVRQHGGKVEVASRAGEGAEFTVWLRAASPGGGG